jgi:hypothetical protein
MSQWLDSRDGGTWRGIWRSVPITKLECQSHSDSDGGSVKSPSEDCRESPSLFRSKLCGPR